jgi:hypothetical protein
LQNRPFLTDLDSRAAVKGSRDPLGIQQIWTHLGRNVVGNLTTVSDSVRDFTVMLFGYYYANLLTEELGSESILSSFLKWEQLAGYVRANHNKDFSFRGTVRVRDNLSNGPTITISGDGAHQILSNQKVYGLWGLYTVPARLSGLVDGNPPHLTDAAIDIIETKYIPRAEKAYPNFSSHILKILSEPTSTINVNGSEALLMQVIGEKILPKKMLLWEKEFYHEYLLMGGPAEHDHTAGRQPQLVDLLEKTLEQKHFVWSMAEVGSLIMDAKNRGESWVSTADSLERIQIAESVLGPSSLIFSHLLGLNGKTVDSIVERMENAWGDGLESINPNKFSQMCKILEPIEENTRTRWIKISLAAATGSYKELMELLVEQNKSVMNLRGSVGSWIDIEDGFFKVHFREEEIDLIPKEQIWNIWRFPYFLDSVRNMAQTLKR